jgi:hypothetical protein
MENQGWRVPNGRLAHNSHTTHTQLAHNSHTTRTQLTVIRLQN